MKTAAVIDRLVHHSVILKHHLTSYNLEESRKRRNAFDIFPVTILARNRDDIFPFS
jgi:hypothetical protein